MAHEDQHLRALLANLQGGRIDLDAALQQLRMDVVTGDSGFATVDTSRQLRTGFPEVIYGSGKSAEQISHILRALHGAGQTAVATRVSEEKATAVLAQCPEVEWHPVARVMVWRHGEWEDRGQGEVLVVCAGTSDLPVAEEAAVVAHAFGNKVRRLTDVGVAGIHRILRRRDALADARVIVVVAGMEGALASVVAGLTDRPVIAVPTSVGYGAAFGGLAALLGMLNSCAPGVSVVNIDNGFGAAYQASLINRLK
jgi:NCAIR mutase (PurE)-related protein